MKEDIERPKVINVGVAMVKERSETNEWEWNAYVFNLRDEIITNVLVSSRGYGEQKGEKKNTTVLRHFIENVDSLDFKKIEPVIPDVFELTNEYWVSFYVDGVIHDKKFVFVKGSITEDNMLDMPFMNSKGVMIR
jgi:hypothetical protein